MPVPREVLREAVANERTLDTLDERYDALGERYSGKVRENFSKDGTRTIVVTDRVSAFDVVLGTIPFKGQVLNQIAGYWFEVTKDLMDNHLIDMPDPQVVRAIDCEPIAVEMVVRSYLTGSSSTSIWRAYEQGARSFCGHDLPEGMKRHEQLAAAIVTPSTKAAKGEHDKSVAKEALFESGVIDAETFDELERRSLQMFAYGQKLASERGLILVDTKYELGRAPDGRIVLIDEIHTPDSSRFWYSDTYEASMSKGEDPRALDKEYVRRWLVSQGFRGDGTPPALTEEVRVEAAARYIETYERVTGRTFEVHEGDPEPRVAANLGV